MTPAPLVKGWCPSAYQPMMSGDGLLVRVRPWVGKFSAEQMMQLCELATEFGNGIINVTSRANLQIRGVSEDTYDAVIDRLLGLNVLMPDPVIEARRNIIVAPEAGQDVAAVFERVMDALAAFPDLPDKIGFAIDTGPTRVLTDVSADFRIERAADASLILRADGAVQGSVVTLDTVGDRLIALAQWFAATGGIESGRIRRHVAQVDLSVGFLGTEPAPVGQPLQPGFSAAGPVFGIPFGQVQASDLAGLISETGASSVTVMPWRSLRLNEGHEVDAPAFVTRADDPRLRVYACPGAPQCAQAHVATTDIAQQLAQSLPPGQKAHVSGCSKGCAFPKAADVTLVGQPDGFALVRRGAPWDGQARTGLAEADVMKEIRL